MVRLILSALLLTLFLPVTISQPAVAALSTYSLMNSAPGNSEPAWGSPNAFDYELGVKVSSSQSGVITAVRYFKHSGSTELHTAHIWDSSGGLLATQSFSSGTVSGLQAQQRRQFSTC